MENKLDKLFRNKLEHHSMQPSANAWEKVAAGFPKKNNTIVWVWRMAAAVAIVGTIGILVMNSWKVEDGSTLANEPVKKNTEQIAPAETKKTEVIEAKKQQPTQERVKPKQTITPKVFNRPAEQPVAEMKQETQTQNETITIATTETNTQTTELPAFTETKVTPAAPEKTLVIVYTLAAVESKPAVEEPAKTKPLQRVLTFAKDVKGGETTLASVRDWKDNFFGTEETARVEKKSSNN